MRLLYQVRTYFQNKWCRTRGARDGSDLNRTLGESPRHRLASLGNPKKKNVSCSFVFRGGGFFLKWKGRFSFWGSARKDIRAVWRGEIRTRFCQNYFLGERIWQNLGWFLCLHFVRAEEGSGEESARAFVFRKNWRAKLDHKNEKEKLYSLKLWSDFTWPPWLCYNISNAKSDNET